jgi:uncharacterized protein
MNYILKYKTQITALCKKFKVKKLYAFGSAVSDKFNQQTSDVDLIVELDKMEPLEKGELLMNLWDEFENLFKRKVDLLTDQPIQNKYLSKNIDKTKVLIYEQ